MITQYDYCTKVCGAKCCHVPKVNVPCCRLDTKTKACTIYKERYEQNAHKTLQIVGFYETPDEPNIGKPFICYRINDLIAQKRLPQDIEDQCCFAHPELLEKDYVWSSTED